MASVYPHQSTAIIAIICTLVVGGTIAYLETLKPATNTGPDSVVTTPGNTNTPLPVSSDWQKQFAAGSSTISLKDSTKKVSPGAPKSLTLTDRVGRNFIVSYVQLEQANLIHDEEALKDAASYAIQNTLQSAPTPKQYKLTDISTLNSDSSVAIHTYGNTIGSAFALYSPRNDPAAIAAEAFEKDDMGLLLSIDPIITGYTKTATALLATPVPPSLAQAHLNVINGLSAVAYVAQGLRNSETDPMQGMVALGTYGAALNTLQTGLQNIKVYFDSHGVTFAKNEPGSSFSTIQ